MRWLHSIGQFLHRDERGVSAVEFALLAAPLLLIVIEVFDFGLGIWTYNNVSEAVRAGARYAIVRGANHPGLPGAPIADDLPGGDCTAPALNSVRAVVCQYAFPLDPTRLTVSVDAPNDLSRETSGPVVVTATYVYTPLLAGVLNMPNITINLKSQSQMNIACC